MYTIAKKLKNMELIDITLGGGAELSKMIDSHSTVGKC